MRSLKLSRDKKPLSEKIAFSIAFFFLALYVAFVLFFFVLSFLIALKENQDAFISDQIDKRILSWPHKPSLSSLFAAFHSLGAIDGHSTFLSITWNSIWRTTIHSVFAVMSSAMVCYILVFYKSRFTKFLYNLGIFVAVLPVYGAAGASYRLFSNLGLINNPLILITSISLYGGFFFYMYSFFKTISWEYAEASFIDGCGHFRAFFHIMFPMALPNISALFIMEFVNAWNNYESTLLYMSKYPNLAYAIYAYEQATTYQSNIPAYFAGILVSLLPIFILFLVFQNSIMEKVHLSGLKG